MIGGNNLKKNKLKENVEFGIIDFDLFSEKLGITLNTLPYYMQQAIQKIIVKYPNINLEFFKHLPHLPNYVNKLFKKIFKYSYGIIFYCGDKIIESIKLQVNYTPKNIKKVKMPPELQADYLLTNEIDNANENIKITINKFIEMLHDNFSEEMLLYFYRNIVSLNTKFVSKQKDFTNDSIVLGSYRADKNEMLISDETDESTIFHELFHLASSYYDSKNKMVYCGFKQRNQSASYNIGIGINEGYTQLLTNRYSEENPYSYPKETRIAEIIESVIGKENMQKYYFTANLKGLIAELTKYKSEEEVMKFIQMVDFSLKYSLNIFLIPSKDKKLESCEQYIEKFMLDISLNKIKSEITNYNLNTLVLKLRSLYMNVIYNNHKTISKFEFAEYVSKVLGCNITFNELGILEVNRDTFANLKVEESKKGKSL